MTMERDGGGVGRGEVLPCVLALSCILGPGHLCPGGFPSCEMGTLLSTLPTSQEARRENRDVNAFTSRECGLLNRHHLRASVSTPHSPEVPYPPTMFNMCVPISPQTSVHTPCLCGGGCPGWGSGSERLWNTPKLLTTSRGGRGCWATGAMRTQTDRLPRGSLSPRLLPHLEPPVGSGCCVGQGRGEPASGQFRNLSFAFGSHVCP